MKSILIMSVFCLFGCSETFVTRCVDVDTNCGEGGLGGVYETGGAANSGGSGGSVICETNQDPLSCWNSCSVGVLAVSQGELAQGVPAPLLGDNDPKNPMFQNKFVESSSCKNECVSFGQTAHQVLRESFPDYIKNGMTFVICNNYNPANSNPHAADPTRTDCHNASELVIDVGPGIDPVKFDPNVYYCTSDTINGSALFPWKF